ncbi:MAG: hypothetical protein NTU61_04635 [Candidatus Altiarchaeota archaeon]|nr:hypothetical protein [Candidatus Altiarchaeota archaeon]
MKNCGRCGKPLYNPAEAVCYTCRKMISKGASKHVDRMNKRAEMDEILADTIENPGKIDKDDPRFEHYVETYDASAVWARDLDVKKKKR